MAFRRRARAITALVAVMSAFALMLGLGSWPQVYMFATDPQASVLSRLLSAPVHLSDDVMITLRTGRVLVETGVPSINFEHLAQASTSYLMPYVFAPLILLLPANAAVVAYACMVVTSR